MAYQKKPHRRKRPRGSLKRYFIMLIFWAFMSCMQALQGEPA
jgi:hypothetical protein